MEKTNSKQVLLCVEATMRYYYFYRMCFFAANVYTCIYNVFFFKSHTEKFSIYLANPVVFSFPFFPVFSAFVSAWWLLVVFMFTHKQKKEKKTHYIVEH